MSPGGIVSHLVVFPMWLLGCHDAATRYVRASNVVPRQCLHCVQDAHGCDELFDSRMFHATLKLPHGYPLARLCPTNPKSAQRDLCCDCRKMCTLTKELLASNVRQAFPSSSFLYLPFSFAAEIYRPLWASSQPTSQPANQPTSQPASQPSA